MFGVSSWEMMLLFVVALLLFGKRLPEVARSLGKGMMEFKKGLYDIQDERIYAYPYEDFKGDLSAKSQASLTAQYEQAVAKGKMVVFVRDNDKGRLVSYMLDYE